MAGSLAELAPGIRGPLAEKVEILCSGLVERQPLMVAYSGGVDSSCLLAVAHRVLGGRVMGVIADSPSLPRRALAAALEQADAMGAPLKVLRTAEFDNGDYSANRPDRCYFCKAELFSRMEAMAREEGFAAIAYGENSDDLAAERPGSRAAKEFAVLAPLREAGLGKAEVRELARHLGLSSSDAPSQPCLSSRILHGIPVTPQAVALVERGEDAMAGLGFRIFRVRLVSVEPLQALVQVAPEELERAAGMVSQIEAAVLGAGFSRVDLDPAGYRGAGLL